MALEELIVAWSKERPAWQRRVMRQVAAGEVLSDTDFEGLIAEIVADIDGPEPTFTLEQLPEAGQTTNLYGSSKSDSPITSMHLNRRSL